MTWQEIDWGNVPAWFGSVLTGGSLLLGFSILRRDRKEAQRSQAAQVVLWGDATQEGPTVYTLLNGSQLPILAVDFRVKIESGLEVPPDDGREVEKFDMRFFPTLAAGESIKMDKPHMEGIGNITTVDVVFIDSNGIWWNLGLGETVRRTKPGVRFSLN